MSTCAATGREAGSGPETFDPNIEAAQTQQQPLSWILCHENLISFFSGCLKTFDAGGSSLIQYHHLRLVSRVPTVRAAAGPKVSHIHPPFWCQSITYSLTYVSSGALCQMHEISHIHCRMCHQEHCARCIILACAQNQHGPAIQTGNTTSCKYKGAVALAAVGDPGQGCWPGES